MNGADLQSIEILWTTVKSPVHAKMKNTFKETGLMQRVVKYPFG